MSINIPEPTAPVPTPTPTPEPPAPEPAAPKAPAEEPTDWKAESRKWEARAKASKDAEDKLAAYEESQKTEAQKLADRAAAAEAKAAEYERKEQVAAWKAQVSDETGVPVAALSGATLEDITAHAEVLKPLISKEPNPVPYIVPTEGTQSGKPPASQLTQADIDQMSPEAINTARRAGRLNKLLGIS